MPAVVIPHEPVDVLATEEFAERRRTGLVAAITVVVLALVILIIWLAVRNSSPDKPYACGSEVSVVNWNTRTFTLTGGTPLAWPQGPRPGSEAALKKVCAAALAFQAAAHTTTVPATVNNNNPTTTGRLIPATTRPLSPPTVRAIPAPTSPPSPASLPTALPPGTSAPIGDGLTLALTGFNPDGSATVSSMSGGTAPSPAPGHHYVVVTVQLTNPSPTSITPTDLTLRTTTGQVIYEPAGSLTTSRPLDLSQPVPPSATDTGDVVFDVLSSDVGALTLRAETPTRTTYFAHQ
jgi:hypothetical protein